MGFVWLHGFGALEKPTMVSLSWPEPDVSPEAEPRLGNLLTRLHQVICLSPCQCGFWIMEKCLCEELLLLITHTIRFPCT